MDAGSGSGSGNASGRCYYELLGVRKTASATDIRAAYRRLALKWHPDRCAKDPAAAGEAKQRFQRIQEAYSVLSDKGKRAMYDLELFDPLDDDDQVQGFSDFMKELLEMMDAVKNEKPYTLEELRKMLDDIRSDVGGSSSSGGGGPRVPSDSKPRDTMFTGAYSFGAEPVQKPPPDTLEEELQKMMDDIMSDDRGSSRWAGVGGGSSRGGGVGSSRGGGVGGRVPSDATRRTRVSPYPQPRRF